MFGATGDLARRKLLPGLFHLAAAGLMPDRYQIIGSSRGNLTGEQFRDLARQAIANFGISKPTGAAWHAFQRTLSFASAERANAAPLTAAIERAERAIGGSPGRLFHLAIPPVAFESTVTMLGTAGLAPGSRVIIEKPFGTDLASAHTLNNTVHAIFDESHVFRIDHFLGKESVDNILAFRFANGLFEPVWNRQHIAYVQIDVPETVAIEGRADFYDHTGAYRDMIVTHLFQVLGFLAMERDRERAQRRQVIVNAARELAEAEGWESVTTRRLAERIEYSQPVLYSHFEGKDGIVSAVALEGFGELAATLHNAREGADSPHSEPRAVASAYMEFARANPALYEAMFTLRVDLTFAQSDTPAPLHAGFAELREALAPLTGDRDAETFTEIVWSALHGLATLSQAGRLRPDFYDQRLAMLVDQLGTVRA